jgi:PAS domain S-box-containing protein
MTPGAAIDAVRSGAWPRWTVPVVGALVIGSMIAMAVLDIVRGYRLTAEDAGRELETQARIIAEQTARSVQAIDVVLRHTAQEYRSGRLARLDADAMRAYLKDQAVGLVQIDGFALHDANGDARALSWRPPGSTINIAHLEGFRRLRDDPGAGLIVGAAIRAQSDQQWIIPIGRRLETPSGEFAGVIGARGRVDYFQSFYRDVRLDAGTNITLMHRDTTLIARYPPMPTAIGEPFALLDKMLAARDVGERGPIRIVSPIDGVERFAALRTVPDYPLEVVVTRDVAFALAPWRGMARGTALRTLALSALAALLLWMTQRQLARLRAVRDRLDATTERFALAVAGSDDGIWDWDHRTDEVFASARTRELLGLPPGPETTPRAEWFAALQFHPEDAPRRLEAMEAHLAAETPHYEGEYRVRHADGGYRWVRVRGLCVRDAAGRPLRMAGSVSDIDARKRAEEAMRVSEERYAIAVSGSEEAHWVWDLATDELFVSSRFNEIFRLPAGFEATTRADYLQHVPFHTDDRDYVLKSIDDHVAGLTPRLDIEYRIVGEGGEIRWIHSRGRCFPDVDGRRLRMAGASTDVTERKRADEAVRTSEERLRESEERYQLAVAGCNQGVWDWDLRSDMVFLSVRAQELFGCPCGEPLRPRRDWIGRWVYHPDDRGRVRRAVSDYLHGGTKTFEMEYRMRHADGRWRWYRDRGVALRDAEGRAYRMAGSIEDITDRKHAEAERDRLEGQLRQNQKLEAMGTLAGGVAHDFNNILAAILGYGEMAQKEAPEGSPLRRHIDAAMSAGMRARALVERILAFSRSGMGERVSVHVQSVVTEVLDTVVGSLPAGIRLESRLAAGNAAVLGDPTQLHQVVMNLLSNAVHAIRAEGTITLSIDTLALHEPRRVATSGLPAGDYVRLCVADTGTGIAPHLIDRIFDPFFTTKEIGVGTGLGLSLVHGIVSDLGGGVEVDSTLGAGATFTVYLLQQGVAALPMGVETPVVNGTGETILLVDDEASLVELGEEMMARLGYEPVGFASAAEALKAFRLAPERFDAVLSDEAMPGMSGTELAAEIRKIRPGIPIVLISGYVTPAMSARAREAGVADVLAKPLVSQDIARCLAEALHR